MSYEAEVIRAICDVLSAKLKKPLPSIITDVPKLHLSSRDPGLRNASMRFLKKLTEEVSPLFIVLDSIGDAFYADGVDARDMLKRFIEFANAIIRSWMELLDVFFVLLGSVPFLSYVEPRSTGGDENNPPSSFAFELLSLDLLRPPKIEEAMKKTPAAVGGQTIKHACSLTDDEVTEVTKHLFVAMSGQPQLLCEAFANKSFSSLTEYTEDQLIARKRRAVLREVLKYRQHVKRLGQAMPSITDFERMQSAGQTNGTTVSMGKLVEIGEGKQLTLDAVARKCFKGWEGTLEKATVYASPEVRDAVACAELPFRKYAKHVADI